MSADEPALVFRAADRRDLAQVMRVMERAFDPAYGEAWNRMQVEGMLDMPGCWMFVAITDDIIIGFSLIRAILDEAELLLLAVDPAWQGRNVGRGLLHESIAAARHRNIRHIHLEVRETNKAVNLYKSVGFVHGNTRKGYYRGKDGKLFDALSFVMNLN